MDELASTRTASHSKVTALVKASHQTLVQGSMRSSDEAGSLGTAQVRRRTKTRGTILLAARALLAVQTKGCFTIDDVVQKAGVAKGSFYNHFPDKETLTEEVCREVRVREEREIAAVNQGIEEPAARIARAMALYARLALTSPDEARIITLGQVSALSIRSSANSGLVHDLREGLQSGKIVVPSIEAGAMLVMGQTAILMSRLIARKSGDSACDLSQQCIALTLIGVGLEHRTAHQLSAQAVEAIVGGVVPTATA